MTARRRVLPNFGQFLVTLRERSKRWGTPAFAKHAKSLGLHQISENKLKQHEAGITSDVRAEFLRDLSALYQTPYPALLRALVIEKYGYDLAVGVEVQAVDVEKVIESIGTSLGKTPTVPPQQTDTPDAAIARARRTSDPGTEVGRVGDKHWKTLATTYEFFVEDLKLDDDGSEELVQAMKKAAKKFAEQREQGGPKTGTGKS